MRIASAIVEHNLWYFVQTWRNPGIEIVDDDVRLRLDEVYEELMHASAELSRWTVRDIRSTCFHVKLRARAGSAHTIVFCADDRTVGPPGNWRQDPWAAWEAADDKENRLRVLHQCPDIWMRPLA